MLHKINQTAALAIIVCLFFIAFDPRPVEQVPTWYMGAVLILLGILGAFFVITTLIGIWA